MLTWILPPTVCLSYNRVPDCQSQLTDCVSVFFSLKFPTASEPPDSLWKEPKRPSLPRLEIPQAMYSPWGYLNSELQGRQGVILVPGVGSSQSTASLISLAIRYQPVVKAKSGEAWEVWVCPLGFINSVWTWLIYMQAWPWTTCWPWEASGLFQYNGSDNDPSYTSVKIAHVLHGNRPDPYVWSKPLLPESTYYYHCFMGLYQVPWQLLSLRHGPSLSSSKGSPLSF